MPGVNTTSRRLSRDPEGNLDLLDLTTEGPGVIRSIEEFRESTRARARSGRRSTSPLGDAVAGALKEGLKQVSLTNPRRESGLK